MNFKQQEFYLFLAHIKKYVFQQRSICFPDGEHRLLMHSAADEISLAFTEDEWEDIKEVLTESAYLANVYDILKGEK
ncbi:hypothetical protein KXS00_05200 [Olivibacter jilunii]|nr:hypothetical protein [Olivibacter sp. 47]MDM8177392.1 hypothetical protein [Olivibacter sp. 47]